MQKSFTLEQLDPNMVITKTINEPDVCYYDVRQEPFEVYGLYNYRTEPNFKRMPDDVAKTVSEGVATLSYATAGGRVRFSTDSLYVGIRAVMPHIQLSSHFAMTGSAGFDLFVDDPETGISRFHRPFRPDIDVKNGYESILKFTTRQLRHFTIHFPSYSHVKDLYIGLQKDAAVGKGMKYRDTLPIVYYGSSITQGACASRPGNTYQNIISRRFNMDYINLGFSGNGKAEDTMIEYLASLPMSAFVSDYDHNAPSADYLKSTHCKLYQAIRASHPDIPYIMLSRPDFDCEYKNNLIRRDVIMDTYRYARAQGDTNVYYIDGAGVFRNHYVDMCTVDGCHPTDLGFALIADAIGDELRRALTQKFI